MFRNRSYGTIDWRYLTPIQLDSCNLNLFDLDEQRVSGKAVTDSVVVDSDYLKHDCKQSRYNPCRGAAGEVTKGQGHENTANKDYSSCGPILTTDRVEEIGPAVKTRDLLVKLLQTSHAGRNIS